MLYEDANWFYRLMRWLVSTAAMAWVFSWSLHHIDRFVYRLTGSRSTLGRAVSGLPVIMLETVGARSGRLRRTPLLGIPDGENLVVVASNWGQHRHPAWYHNLVAHPDAVAMLDGGPRPVRARLTEGEERRRLWEHGQRWYPGWPKYESRASSRRIPIFVLEPASRTPRPGRA